MPTATPTKNSNRTVQAERVRVRRNHPILKVLALVVAVVVAAVLVSAGAVISEGRKYETTTSDAIVVLGASQYWGEPSPVLANRLDHAADLYRRGVAPVIITVGGGIPGDRTTEAEAGAAYLTSLGVPTPAIVAVPRGSDTITSMEAVAQRAVHQSWREITVVSDRAHLARSAAIADALGFRTHVSGSALGDGALLTPEYVARESVGLLRFQLWDRWQLEPAL